MLGRCLKRDVFYKWGKVLGFSSYKKLNFLGMLILSWCLWACGNTTPASVKSLSKVAGEDEGQERVGDDSADEAMGLDENISTYLASPEDVDYRLINEQVFKKGQCLNCHSTNGSTPDRSAIRHGVDLSSYSSLFLRLGVVPGNLKESRIYQASLSDKSHSLVSVDGYKPLADDLRQLLKLWILNCGIEDHTLEGNVRLIYPETYLEKVRLCF